MLLAGLAVAPSAAAQSSGGEVDVQVAAGIDGRIGDSSTTPARITMTSPRARTVDVEVGHDFEMKSYRVELVAGAPVELDVALTRPPMVVASFAVTVTVREPGRGVIGSARTEVVLEPKLTVVGVGPSLIGKPVMTSTVAGVQDALLVPLDADVISRPGALPAMSGIVLGAEDVDALSDEARDRLRSWVWHGGNLAVDVPRAASLPVVDLPAGSGGRTAVGAGWVRFTEGRAATGKWDSVVEPAVVRAVPGANPFNGDAWFDRGHDWGWLGLVDIRFLPTIVVVAAVFGTALVVGPLMWFLLRTRSRRRWMWIASPALSLCVAAGLLVVGQGIFTRAETRAAGNVSADPWSSTGDVVLGLKSSQDLELASDVDVIAASPSAVVSDIGDGRTARVDLPRNGFGYVGLGGVSLDGGPQIEVSATAIDDERVEVTVTNRTDVTLHSVNVRAAGRSRPFEDVPPGESVSLPFIVGSELDAFANVFPFAETFAFESLAESVASERPRALPLSRGLVLVSGIMRPGLSAAGLEAPQADLLVQTIAPISSESESSTALRIDMVGSLPRDPNLFIPPDDGFGAVTTTTMAQVPGPNDGGSGGPVVSHVRLSAAAGRSAAPCAVHTAVQSVSWWDGSAWVPAENVGEHFASDRMIGANEVQKWALPAIAPGSELYLRLTGNLLLVAPQLFDCAAP